MMQLEAINVYCYEDTYQEMEQWVTGIAEKAQNALSIVKSRSDAKLPIDWQPDYPVKVDGNGQLGAIGLMGNGETPPQTILEADRFMQLIEQMMFVYTDMNEAVCLLEAER